MDGVFVSTGFNNWKEATVSFWKHKFSECHHAATELVVTLPAQTEDIGESLSNKQSEEKAEKQAVLLKLFGNVRFLTAEGLAF